MSGWKEAIIPADLHANDFSDELQQKAREMEERQEQREGET